jgi:hypothetical protein
MQPVMHDMAVMVLCVCCRFDRSPGDIVLYGQSVGSGPSVDLAARTRGLGGVVLHSPLMSGTVWLQQNDLTMPYELCAALACSAHMPDRSWQPRRCRPGNWVVLLQACEC